MTEVARLRDTPFFTRLLQPALGGWELPVFAGCILVGHCARNRCVEVLLRRRLFARDAARFRG